MYLLFFIISALASVIGAICGIGGGVIIKPTLDIFQIASVSTISFLSGCTVLCMSLYSVGKVISSKESMIDFKTGTPLSIGAVIGGILGKQLFTYVKGMFSDPDVIGAVQAFCLLVITVGTLIYTLNKHKVKTVHIRNTLLCMTIGLSLGATSSFLGIGGGPINLVVLYFFFSMETKTAAQNSLYIILFSQAASLISTILTKTVPEFELLALILMSIGGISGGIIGRLFNRRMSSRAVDNLFIALMITIIFISGYNTWQYAF